MNKKITIFFVCFSALSVAFAQQGPVTSETRNKEFIERHKKIAPELNRSNYCKRSYDFVKTDLLQILYRIDGNLPQISDSKQKRLEFVVREWANVAPQNVEYRKNLWRTEMYPDADYWQWILQEKLRPLISKLESLNWDQASGVLLNHLELLRGKNYYSTLGQERASNLISGYLEIYANSLDVFIQLQETDRQFDRLKQSQRLNRSLMENPIERAEYLGRIGTIGPGYVKLMINCNLRFLGTF